MNLKITSEVSLSTGQTVTNAAAWLTTYPTMNDVGGLDISCDINTYVSSALRDAKADKIYPVASGTYDKVSGCEVVLTPEQSAEAGLPLVIYQAVATYLNTKYGWTVIVEM